MIFVAAYDIQDDAVRQKVASLLQEWGFTRVQRSLYVGRLPRGSAQDLLKTVERIIDGKGHLVLIPVTEAQLERALEAGAPPYSPLKPPRYGQVLLV